MAITGTTPQNLDIDFPKTVSLKEPLYHLARSDVLWAEHHLNYRLPRELKKFIVAVRHPSFRHRVIRATLSTSAKG